MAISKVTLNGETLMDVTDNTSATDNMLYGTKGTAANGTSVTGTIVATPVDDTLSTTSHNAIENAAVATALANKADSSAIPDSTSDLTNDSNFVSDANYVHTDNNFTTALKNKLDGIATNATVDDHKWNDVELIKYNAASTSDIYVPYTYGLNETIAYFGTATSTPTSKAIAKFNNDKRLSSVTPVAGDDSTLVATTAFVQGAINNLPAWSQASTKPSYTASEVGAATSTHVHGNITNDGDITSNVAIANGDRLVINDESASKINNSSITFGSSTSTFLANNGTWQTPSGVVTSVNGMTGAVGITVPSASTTTPSMDGTGSYGSGTDYARSNHVHPSDTTKMTKGVDYVTAGQKSGTTLGNYATAEGLNATASAQYSHAEGSYASATASTAHAEGYYTVASGTESHAEGNHTTAAGKNSHAEGGQTTANANNAHAEGYSTNALGNESHAEGVNTTANHLAQHVFGQWNILDSSTAASTARGNYVEIVGNGSADNNRSNARTLDWLGNETLAGKLTVGADPTNNMDVATRQYVSAATVRPNILDNWLFAGGGSQQGQGQFPINHNRLTSYPASSRRYFINRWELLNQYTAATLQMNGIALSVTSGGHGYINQYIYWEALKNKTVTYSVLCAKDNVIYLASGTGTVSNTAPSSGATTIVNFNTQIPNGAGCGLYVYNDGTLRAQIGQTAGNSILLIAAKLEIGNTQTLAHQENGTWMLNEIPNYTEQLLRCQENMSASEADSVGYPVVGKIAATGFPYIRFFDANNNVYQLGVNATTKQLRLEKYDGSSWSLIAAYDSVT